MEKLGLNEVRKLFIEFYKSKEHYAAKSASLVPKGDKSLLLINSGMAPLKPYFSGIETPPAKRMTTCQKCIRTGDIENVGLTARHGTFFEMLGSFSFGDYFKKESLEWGWEFITEHLKMPADKIWATIYLDDDQAYEIWRNIGIPDERIVRLGKEDNFWEIGLGPCGPDSEIFFDRGEEFGCGKPDCKPGCDCDRYIEFWNHVFTQFSKEEDGSYTDLAHPNIDTGMGLERMACILQGVDSIFEVDTIRHILEGVSEVSGKAYNAGNEKDDISIRIITDHLRSMVFMISDDIRPSNEGRGYVLRRLIRRAARHGRLLGIDGSFLSGLVDRVVEVSGEAYPELVEKKDVIKKAVAAEEDKFMSTLNQGCNILNEYMDEMKKEGSTCLSGDKVFKLYDTYGFPLEVTEEILQEKGFTLDDEGFKSNMEEQRTKAREGRHQEDDQGWEENLIPDGTEETLFKGYSELETESEVDMLFIDGKPADTASAGDKVAFVVGETPFYSESGGQISDIGIMSTDSGRVEIDAVEKNKGVFVHRGTVVEGNIAVGTPAKLAVDRSRRNKTARNHSATHLLQSALRNVLGDHVHQAGSLVTDDVLRFDFTHFQQLADDEIEAVEKEVNENILKFLPVSTVETDMDTAKNMGATALFDEKYGDRVRVVSMGDASVELCGGTHVENTGMIGSFRIMSEQGIASGVRRIEAVTGTGVLDSANKLQKDIIRISENLKSKPDQVVQRSESIVSELKETRKELEEFKKQSMGAETDSIIDGAVEINGVKLICSKFKDYNINDLRGLTDDIRAREDSAVMVFASVTGEKVTMLVAVTDDLTDRFNAGKLIKDLAKEIGGGGGGKADMAQAGGQNPSGIDKAFKVAEELLS